MPEKKAAFSSARLTVLQRKAQKAHGLKGVTYNQPKDIHFCQYSRTLEHQHLLNDCMVMIWVHLEFSMHMPFLRTALSQSRNYSLRRRDFACFANTFCIIVCWLEQWCREGDTWVQVPSSGGSDQHLQLPSHMWQLQHHVLIGPPLVPLRKPNSCTASCAQVMWPESKQEIDCGFIVKALSREVGN